jgi:hypothetical protein
VHDHVVEEFTDEAIWELMYFGHPRGEIRTGGRRRAT